MTDSESTDSDLETWEDRFKRLIAKFSIEADHRARSASDRQEIISNIELKRLILQYSLDLQHRLYAVEPSIDSRDAIFESLALLLSSSFMCGVSEGRGRGPEVCDISEVSGIIKSERTTGPRPVKHDEVVGRLLQAREDGIDISGMKQETLTELYGGGASRGTVVKARQRVLAMFNTENDGKAPNDSNKS